MKEIDVLAGIINLIIDTIAAILGGAMLLRFWMQAVRVRPPMTIGQFVYQVSDWLIKPMRRLLPGAGGFDWASLLGAYLIALIATVIKLAIWGLLTPEAAAVQALLHLIMWALYGVTGLIILEVIFSWVNPHAPLAPFVGAMNEPVLRPLRRVIPPIGGIDFSSFAALILLQIAMQVVGRFQFAFL